MSIRFEDHLGNVRRTVRELERDGKPARGVTLERSYQTTASDLWDAVTNPERLPRWFLPVKGTLALGGRYQLEGNAGGTITECVPPEHFAATWEFGGGMSWIDVSIVPDGDDRARFALTHICPVDEFWEKFGPGAVGLGWDLGLLGLSLHVAGWSKEGFDEEAFAASPEGRAIIHAAGDDWGRAAREAGEDEELARTQAERTKAFYTGEPAPDEGTP